MKHSNASFLQIPTRQGQVEMLQPQTPHHFPRAALRKFKFGFKFQPPCFKLKHDPAQLHSSERLFLCHTSVPFLILIMHFETEVKRDFKAGALGWNQDSSCLPSKQFHNNLPETAAYLMRMQMINCSPPCTVNSINKLLMTPACYSFFG